MVAPNLRRCNFARVAATHAFSAAAHFLRDSAGVKTAFDARKKALPDITQFPKPFIVE